MAAGDDCCLTSGKISDVRCISDQQSFLLFSPTFYTLEKNKILIQIFFFFERMCLEKK